MSKWKRAVVLLFSGLCLFACGKLEKIEKTQLEVPMLEEIEKQ